MATGPIHGAVWPKATGPIHDAELILGKTGQCISKMSSFMIRCVFNGVYIPEGRFS